MPGVEVMNEVALNQLVVRFRDPAGRDDDAHTRAVTARVIAGGVCYPSGTTWRGVAAMRISVSNWATDADDVARSLDAIARAPPLRVALRDTRSMGAIVIMLVFGLGAYLARGTGAPPSK